MDIELSLAQDIVESMKSIIHQDINFISKDGLILASTDKNRIGDIHGGARKVLKTNQPLIIEYDGQYKSTRQGINLPIFLEHEIIGVIGITGKIEEVAEHGEIIKKMTEILIRENIYKEVLFNRRDINSQIIDYIYNEERDIHSLKMLYNVNLDTPRFALIGVANSSDGAFSVENVSSIYSYLNSTLGNNEENIYDIRGDFVIILMQAQSYNHLRNVAETSIDYFHKKFNMDFTFGIGVENSRREGLRESINQAKVAVEWSTNYTKEAVSFYEELKEGVILNNVSFPDSTVYLKQIFNDLDEEMIEEIFDFLAVFEKNNGSLNKCAKELYIHKNSVQYKINKIKKVIGLDPRNLSDFFLLNLAKIVYQLNK